MREQKKNVIIGGEKKREERNGRNFVTRYRWFRADSHRETVFYRRENHGVVGHWRDQSLGAAPTVPLGAASRKRAARSTLTKVVEATAKVRSTNWTPAAWQYNYGPCALGRACVHACVSSYHMRATSWRSARNRGFDSISSNVKF